MSTPTDVQAPNVRTLANLLAGRGGPLRYAAAGLVNSGVGYAVILALGAAGLHPFAANAGGFAAGFLVSLALAERWTFAPAARRGAPRRYAAAFAACYAGNLGLVAALLALSVPAPAAQAAGVIGYAGAFYLTCRWWVYGDVGARRADAALAWRIASTRPGTVVMALAAPVAVLAALVALTPSDVVWQMWIARQLNGGADLYTGIQEVNPPLWFWMAMPADALAGVLGIHPHAAIKLGVAAYGLAGLALCARLTRGEASAPRLTVLGALAFVTLILPAGHYAQREHITLIACTPYLLLAARRVSALRGPQVAPVPWAFCALVGAFAAPGLALKHYFVLLPVLIEVWRILRGGRPRDLFRSETITLGVGALVYAATVLTVSMDFFTEAVPFVRLAYDGYRTAWPGVFLVPVFVVSLTGFAFAWVSASSKDAMARLRFEVLSIGFTVFVLAYCVQMKGLAYHLVPIAGLAFVMMTVALKAASERGRTVIGALLLSLVAVSYNQSEARLSLESTYPFDAAGIERGDRVMVLSHVASWSLPEVERRGAVWTSRGLGLWPMTAVAKARGPGAPSARDDITVVIARQVVHDMTCNPPEFLLVDHDLTTHLSDFEGIPDALSSNADFRALISAYETVARDRIFEVRARTHALPAPADPDECRVIH